MCSLMHVCLLILEYIGLTTEHQILSQIAFISFCIVTLYDWSGKLAPLSQPIRSKIKTNCKSLAFLAFYSYCVLTPSSHWLSAVLYLLWLAVEYQDVILFFFFPVYISPQRVSLPQYWCQTIRGCVGWSCHGGERSSVWSSQSEDWICTK